MNYRYFLRVGMLLGLLFIFSCAKNINDFTYIHIKECSLPIPHSLYLKDSDSDKFRYFFVSKKDDFFSDNRLDPQINIIPSVKENEKMIFQKSLNKFGYKKSIDKIGNMEIWYLQESYNNIKLNLYSYIFLKNTVITLTNHNKAEVEYIANYCLAHPR